MAEDFARPDPIIHSFIEERWRGSLECVQKAMDLVREVVPEMISVLPESDGGHINRSLEELQMAYASLHRAGPGVMGESNYEAFLANRIETHMEEKERGSS